MDEKITRFSKGLGDNGLLMVGLGLFGILFGIIPPLVIGLPSASHAEGAKICTGCGFVIFLLGLPMLITHYSFFKVSPGYTAITKSGKLLTEGLHFGIKPTATVVANERRTVQIPQDDTLIELETPDDGILGVAVTLSYSPDFENHLALRHFQDVPQLELLIANRIRSALNTWIKQKPLPGTLKRALSMPDEAEKFIIGKLTAATTAAALVLHDDTTPYLDTGYRIGDLGICLHEVHITEMQSLKRGTGKPDWGDDDLVFDAEKVRIKLRGKVSNISDLRKEKKALIAEFPEEEDYIETLYEDELIKSKEHRDR
jgi:hypothetical protein